MLIQTRSFVDVDEKISRVEHELEYHTLMVLATQKELDRLKKMKKEDRELYDATFNRATLANG